MWTAGPRSGGAAPCSALPLGGEVDVVQFLGLPAVQAVETLHGGQRCRRPDRGLGRRPGQVGRVEGFDTEPVERLPERGQGGIRVVVELALAYPPEPPAGPLE